MIVAVILIVIVIFVLLVALDKALKDTEFMG